MKAQISLEFMISISIYITIILTAVQLQSRFKAEGKTRLKAVQDHRSLTETAEACSYKYLHGPGTHMNQQYLAPDQIEGNKLMLNLKGEQVTASTLSPHLSTQKGGIICSSTQTWYPEEAR